MNDIIELSVIEEYTAIIESNIRECNELLTEKIDWQQFKTNVVTAVKNAWRWIVKRAIYIKESFIRLYKVNKAKKMRDQYDKLMKTQGWAVEFDDLPGDIYDDFFEAGESELIPGLTENDIKTFGRNIIKNKKLIIKSLMNIGLSLAPGVGPAKLAIEINKAFLTLIPLLTDFIATSKEIALLKKKYAGKVKTFKRPDGTIEMEIPAEEYITFDKYIGLANRIINLIMPTNGKSEITCKITGTKDLIQVFKATMYAIDNHDNELNVALENLHKKYKDAYATINNEMDAVIHNTPSNEELQLQQFNARMDKLDKSYDAEFTSIMASHQPMSVNELSNLAISAATDIMSKSVSFYMDGIEYKVKGKYINELLMPITANLSAAYVELMKTCNELDGTGVNCLMTTIKCAGIMMKHMVPTMVKSANSIHKNIIDNEAIRNPNDRKEIFKHMTVPTGRRITRAITMESVYMEAGPREEVRDGFLGDLPEDIRIKVMNIHKMVVATVNEVFKNKAYDPIRNTAWAKTMIEEFLVMPQDKTATGSVRLYKKGKKHSCMIQLTGHVNNNRNDIDHELFHDFIRNVHQSMRKDVRRKYDMTLTCESEHGEHFEGFDVWTTSKVAKQLWEQFADKKTKKAEFHSESVENNNHCNVMALDIEDLPLGLQEMIESVKNDITIINESAKAEKKEKYVPIFGIIKKYSKSKYRNDGTPKPPSELTSIKFHKIIEKLTRGDQYSHAVVSFDDTFKNLYSYEDPGFVNDSIYNDSWKGTDSIYICVMFVKKAERDQMLKYVKSIEADPDKSQYASANLLKAYIGKPNKVDKRFVCSTFTGYIMACSNPKNLHRDYSRLRPEDITILPRAFYVTNVKDQDEFIKRKDEIHAKVKAIYDEYYDEINDYNNHLPKLLLSNKMSELKTSDKIFDYIINNIL